MAYSIPQAWLDHDLKVKPYVWQHRIVSYSKMLLSYGVGLWLLLSGKLAFLYLNLEDSYWGFLSFYFILGLLWKLLGLPFEYLGYRIEKKFQLSRQSLGSFLGDQLKGFLLGCILGGIVLSVFYFLIGSLGNSWWVGAYLFLMVFSILLAQLAPILLIPLFFKLKPMEAGALKDRLLELCRRYQIKVGEVYHLGLGEKTEKGNAAFVGLGKTKRIIIGDTLYEKFPPEEVEAVFAHELGHQVHQDIWKGIGLSAVLLFLAFYITELIYENWLGALLQQTLHSAYGLLFFLITLSVVQIPLGFLQTLFSRQRERAADRFASETVKMPKELASALEKLTYQNWSYFKPAAIIEFFTYSHPAPWRRISKLKQT